MKDVRASVLSDKGHLFKRKDRIIRGSAVWGFNLLLTWLIARKAGEPKELSVMLMRAE